MCVWVVTELPHLNWPRVVATVPLEKDAMEGPFPLEDLALEDATGNNVGTVSAEIPVGPKWCEIRQTIGQRRSFHLGSRPRTL